MRKVVVVAALVLILIALAELLGLRPGDAESGKAVELSDSPSLVGAEAADGGIEREQIVRTPAVVEGGAVGLSVRCVDANNGKGLDGCAFLSASGNSIPEVVALGSGDYLLADLIASNSGPLMVSLEGYSEGTIDFQQGSSYPETGLTLALKPIGGVVRGRVSSVSGEACPNDTVVVAWLAGHSAPRATRAGGILTPGALHCRVDPDGNYELFGLQPERDYSFVAAGDGLVSQGLKEARAGDILDIAVSPVFGAIIRYIDDAGGALKTNPKVFYYTDGITYQPQDGALAVDCPPSLWSLCGIPHGRQLRQSDQWEQAVVLVDDSEFDTKPLALRIRIPGYRLREAVVDLPRVRRSGNPLLTIPLQATTDSWVDVPVAVRRSEAPSLVGINVPTSKGVLHLDPVGKTGQTMVVPIAALDSRVQVISDVPAGDYIVRFRSRSRMYYLPGPDGIIGDWQYTVDSTGQVLSVDLSGAGALRISEVPASAANGYLVVAAGGGYPPSYYLLSEDSVTVDLIVPGQCRVSFAKDRRELALAMAGGAERTKIVTIQAGLLSVLSFQEL